GLAGSEGPQIPNNAGGGALEAVESGGLGGNAEAAGRAVGGAVQGGGAAVLGGGGPARGGAPPDQAPGGAGEGAPGGGRREGGGGSRGGGGMSPRVPGAAGAGCDASVCGVRGPRRACDRVGRGWPGRCRGACRWA